MERRLGAFVQRFQALCSTCNGRGAQALGTCPTCLNRRLVEETVTLNVAIEAGMRDGDRVEFPGASDESLDALSGDVVLVRIQTRQNASLCVCVCVRKCAVQTLTARTPFVCSK